MLVLTRQPDESILIGDEIRVTILDIRGDSVRIGIEAPHRILVDRAEVRERRDEQAVRLRESG